MGRRVWWVRSVGCGVDDGGERDGRGGDEMGGVSRRL